VAYRARASELARQNASTGLALEAKALAAEADLRKAEYDLAGARIQRHLALLNLYSLIGE
jgi:outer membrane protein TolC